MFNKIENEIEYNHEIFGHLVESIDLIEIFEYI